MPITITITLDDDTLGQLAAAVAAAAAGTGVPIHLDYKGIRTTGLYDPATERITITSGPLHGPHEYRVSPAAKALVQRHATTILKGGGERNGWTEWRVSATGAALQSIRSHAPKPRRKRR